GFGQQISRGGKRYFVFLDIVRIEGYPLRGISGQSDQFAAGEPILAADQAFLDGIPCRVIVRPVALADLIKLSCPAIHGKHLVELLESRGEKDPIPMYS